MINNNNIFMTVWAITTVQKVEREHFYTVQMAIQNWKGQCGISSSSWPLYNVSGAGFLSRSKACIRASAFHTLSVVQLAFGSTWTHTGAGEVRTHQCVFLLTLWREQKILNALFLYTQIHNGCFVGWLWTCGTL